MKTPTEFGGDYFEVSGADKVTVDSASLISPHGLKLVDLAFIRGGGMGNGGAFADGASLAPTPEVWANRVAFTAGKSQLAPVTPHSNVPESDGWQVVVGVVPLAPIGGYADGLRLQFHTNKIKGSIEGRAVFAVTRSQTSCPH